MNARGTSRPIGGVETHWRETGEGRPLVLLHGLGGSSYSWRAVADELGKRHRLLIPDLPGFGRSGAPDGFDHSIQGLSRWLVAFLDHHGLDKAHVAGNSLGGMVALMTAMDAPRRVDRVALLGTPLYDGDGPVFIWALRWPLVGRLLEPFLGPRAVRLIGRTAYHDPSVMTEEAVAEYALPLKTSAGRRAAAETVRRVVPSDSADRIRRYRELAHEFLVVCGEHDTVARPLSARRFCAEAPKARLLELDRCAHVPQEERPAEVARALVEFFA